MAEIRGEVLWGQLLGGGAGVEYYFGYLLPENDLGAQDWRSRALTWKYSSIALDFFRDNAIPFWEMHNADQLVGNPENDNSIYCFAKPGSVYLVYVPGKLDVVLDLKDQSGKFTVRWFNPRSGGKVLVGSASEVTGGEPQNLGSPPNQFTEDWLVLVSR